MPSFFKRWLGNLFRVQSIILEITDACNLACCYCYRPPRVAGPERLSPEDCGRILERLRRAHPGLRIAISGGEPLLHPRLEEIVEKVAAADPGFSLLSNLSLLTRDRASGLFERGLRNLQFTFFSVDPGEHDRLRQPGDARATLEGIVTAKRAGFQLTAILLVTPFNLQKLVPTMTMLAGMGVNGFMVNRFNAGSRAAPGQEDLFLRHDQILPFLREVEGFAATWKSPISLGIPIPPCTFSEPVSSFPHLLFSPCPIGSGQGEYFAISAVGDLRICNHHPRPIGNLLRQEWAEIMSGSDYRELLRVFAARPAFCGGCGVWEECRGGCRAAAETWDGDLSLVDPWVRFVVGRPVKTERE